MDAVITPNSQRVKKIVMDTLGCEGIIDQVRTLLLDLPKFTVDMETRLASSMNT